LSDALPGAVYRTVDSGDLDRENRVLGLLTERFADWQAKGYIPSRRIEPGDKTDEPIRTRGWTHWHHLFTPRQLLVHGQFAECSASESHETDCRVACLLGIARCADWDSKLCRWDSSAANEKVAQTFSNQALNTLDSFAGKAHQSLDNSWFLRIRAVLVNDRGGVDPIDARTLEQSCDGWITDPPYADAINYHELSEYLLSWYERQILQLFSRWHADSKRILAIRGSGKSFREGMVDAYRNLAARMPDNGLQIVMFTHQDAGVWADLALILWAAGLRVTAAWTIATETESALKEGNYVQGTVLMVLRKQISDEVAFIDELVPEVETEVERQLDAMLTLDDKEDPNFSDADYQLAAYAAALRVITRYGSIEDIDVAYELSRERARGEESPLARIIEDAVRTASNYLVPPGIPDHLWKRLGPEEKLYLKGLEVEGHGEYHSGVYQEFARGFGVRDYRYMLRTGKANETRLKTASELKRKELGDSAFGHSLVRHALYAVWRASETSETRDSLTWLRSEVPGYWDILRIGIN
jgi:putative DNA methylase